MNDTPAESAAIANDELLLWLHENLPDLSSSRSDYLQNLARLAENDGQLLTSLISPNSGGLAPGVYRSKEFRLGLHRDGTNPTVPTHNEQNMCLNLWQQETQFYLGQHGAHAQINSYEVPLVSDPTVLASNGTRIIQRKIDLLAVASDGLPILIEAKHSDDAPDTIAVSQLFSQLMQGLTYAVTLRYIWNMSQGYREKWIKELPSAVEITQQPLNNLPVILAANPHYWNKIFNWGDKQKHWKDLCTLVKVAQKAHYPIYLGVIREPVSPDTQWKFQVVDWDSLPTPTTNGPIQFPIVATS